MRHPLAGMLCQRTGFLQDKASAGLRTGRAPKKKSFPPIPAGRHGDVVVSRRGLSATCGGLMHGTKERV